MIWVQTLLITGVTEHKWLRSLLSSYFSDPCPYYSLTYKSVYCWLPETTSGIILASTTRSPCIPFTFSSWSTTPTTQNLNTKKCKPPFLKYYASTTRSPYPYLLLMVHHTYNTKFKDRQWNHHSLNIRHHPLPSTPSPCIESSVYPSLSTHGQPQ